MQTSGKSRKGMVAAYYAVAGNEDADAVCSYGSSHGSYALRFADACGDFLVAPGFAVWNAEQCVPHLLLEVGSNGAQRYVEHSACACEILVELPLCLL